MTRRILSALAVAAAVGALFAFPADAGNGSNTFNVTKVVDGPVPAGTQFTIEANCTDGFRYDVTEVFVYDSTGGTQTITGIPGESSCTATETDDGGALSVTYSCAFTVQGNFDSCDGDQGASFGGSDAEATITVTNTFAADDVASDDAAAEPDVVAATPTFTG